MTPTTPEPTTRWTDDSEHVVRVRGLHKRFGPVHALRGVDLDVPAGAVTALIGPSGSGKSTLLRCINHLERPTDGTVEVDGALMGHVRRRGQYQPCGARTLAEQRRATGMVFQHFNLFAHRTAAENVMEGPVGGHGEGRASARSRAEELLDSVGLSDKCDAYPAELSGGQQQRVAIARALASRPKVLLLDEPTSALDPELVGEVLAVIRSLTETGVTMLITTHEISFAEDVARTVVFMDGGLVVERGGPEQVIRHPENERTQRFLTHLRA